MKLKVNRIGFEIDVAEFDHEVWDSAQEAVVDRYWNGEPAPESRHFAARLLWSHDALYARFEANCGEPLVVADAPVLTAKTIGLWDRDVCEIFIAPDSADPRHYFEFEVAPTGEWIDLEVRQLPDRRETEWDYSSGMSVGSRIWKERTISAIRVPWSSIGGRPRIGENRPGNLFRCVGTEPDRGYLAWSPTQTSSPNFHVPDRFGRFEF